MPGVINTKGSGLYMNMQPVLPGIPGATMALHQILHITTPEVKFEGKEVETASSMHPVTINTPTSPGVVTGTTNFLAKPVLNTSKIFSVNNSAVVTSGSLKLQNAGNCPISPMVQQSASKVVFNING